MSHPTENTFLKDLARTVERDRGDRAALRRYWSETTRHQSYPILGKIHALKDKPRTILAALYAEHPFYRKGMSVGKAALQLGKPQNGEHPYDRHFRRLLACDEIEELAQQLHRLVKRLDRKSIGLDYDSLRINLYSWCKTSDPAKREDVKVRWAADFWMAPIP
ncbi:MAG: type I-E CRISPR-associated protein Cse2/CasB, partial [Verrucomicrobiota bacterium]